MIKKILILILIAATLLFFGFYIAKHPELIDTLKSLSPTTIILLTIGYIAVTLINAVVLYYSLLFLNKKTSLSENIALTGYSSIVNFFGPLQSGPGFRAIYLKKKHSVKLRDFFTTTLIFYGFFAIFNVLIISVASIQKFQSLSFYIFLSLTVIATSGVVYYLIKRSKKIQQAINRFRFNDKNFWFIGLGALALTFTTALIYFVEIRQIDTSVSLVQTIIYGAAANLSLFVSLTPGAIGIRESFLMLSQQLHEISTVAVVGASVIDRAFYVGFLAVLFIILLAVNNHKKLPVFQLKSRRK